MAGEGVWSEIAAEKTGRKVLRETIIPRFMANFRISWMMGQTNLRLSSHISNLKYVHGSIDTYSFAYIQSKLPTS